MVGENVGVAVALECVGDGVGDGVADSVGAGGIVAVGALVVPCDVGLITSKVTIVASNKLIVIPENIKTGATITRRPDTGD